MREDEYFGRGDGIKPFLNPAPDCREENWGANNLISLSVIPSQFEKGVPLTNILSKVSG
jgi:hypothetical protein